MAGRYAKLVDLVESIVETFTSFTSFTLPPLHHKHMKSTNMLEQFNEEIKPRTRVVRTFPNETTCLRLIRALGMERHECGKDARYLNIELLAEQRKEGLKVAA